MTERDNTPKPVGKTGTSLSGSFRQQFRAASLWDHLASPVRVWRSKISWRITITVFLAILTVQAVVMFVTASDFKRQKLYEMRELARVFIISSLSDTSDPLSAPLTQEAADRLFSETMISGIAVYGLDNNLIQIFGDTVMLRPAADAETPLQQLSASSRFYEVSLRAQELRRPYNIVVKLYTAGITPMLNQHIRQSVLIMLLLSGLVTSVLMLVLGQWLLEPVMVLRNNLLSAAQNPEKPDVRRARRETRDEIGIALRIANDLIRQNAHNLRKLRSQAEDRIHKLAYYDNLTGLPNRTFFLEKLDDNIRHRVAEEERRLAVFAIDLDHFKDINDTMGHEFGDKLLEAIGKRLVKALPPGSLISRASADEFTAMVVLKEDNPDTATLVDRIFNAMAEPVSILHERFQVRVSIGVAHCPDDGMEARQILKNADIALNRAKEEGRDTVRYYSEDFDLAVQQRFQMLRDLRTALDENQLRLYFHPQFDLRTGQMIGAEALLRWWCPDNSKEGGRFISPADFIPVAEQSGLIVPIGEWVMKTACKINKQWQDKGLPPFRIAVNISGVQFHRADIVALTATALKESGLDPKWLELEVTESVFMENMHVAIDILNQLHQLGVELAVDDFGTGYSSLSYLRQFPIDRLKIDQSFIRNALVNNDDRMIAKTIITLGHSLNLKVIAEGVETVEHEEFLKSEGCDEVQGFKYTKPLPQDQLREYVINHTKAMAKTNPPRAIEDKGSA
ncbi:MAG: EAL domain-containing protein [Alphaproteobacteria bacterium]|nr:EAL domain-containing protein [Alphaproteobacteria bacterium]